MPEALEEWRKLDGSVQANLKKLLAKRLDNPHVPGGCMVNWPTATRSSCSNKVSDSSIRWKTITSS